MGFGSIRNYEEGIGGNVRMGGEVVECSYLELDGEKYMIPMTMAADFHDGNEPVAYKMVKMQPNQVIPLVVEVRNQATIEKLAQQEEAAIRDAGIMPEQE